MTPVSGNRRRWVLGLLLVGAAWLALFADKTPQVPAKPISQPIARLAVSSQATGSPRAKTSEPVVTLIGLSPRDVLIRASPQAPADLFSARSWTPPPPPPPAPSGPAEPPTAPPLPYVYAGKKQEAGQWEVYLTRGELTYIARQGSSLEDAYLVERIAPPSMTFKYRPLGQVQSLNIGD